MPRQGTVLCPSGLELTIRSRKTKDYDILTSEDRHAENRYLEEVILDTIDRGPYPDAQFRPDGKPRVDRGFLMGDFWVLLLNHHMLNMPDKPFIKTFNCDGDGCEYTETCRIKPGPPPDDVESEDGRKAEDGFYYLPVRTMKPEVAEQFAANKNLFEVDLIGKRVTFRLATRGTYDSFLAHVKEDKKKGRKESKYTSLLASRIVRVEGVQESFMAIREWIGNLDEDDEDDLNDLMDDFDCGFDWDLKPWCPNCDEDGRLRVVVDKNFSTRGRQRERPNSRT